jgi:hypothetical protein
MAQPRSHRARKSKLVVSFLSALAIGEPAMLARASRVTAEVESIPTAWADESHARPYKRHDKVVADHNHEEGDASRWTDELDQPASGKDGGPERQNHSQRPTADAFTSVPKGIPRRRKRRGDLRIRVELTASS